ncbi:MAG: hypothetical protein ACLTTQ_03480 [Christensenellales bacterium]
MVNAEGTPIKGKLFFADGSSATVNSETGEIEYSDGSVYIGELRDLQKNGKGKLTLRRSVARVTLQKPSPDGVFTLPTAPTRDRWSTAKGGKGIYRWGRLELARVNTRTTARTEPAPTHGRTARPIPANTRMT